MNTLIIMIALAALFISVLTLRAMMRRLNEAMDEAIQDELDKLRKQGLPVDEWGKSRK